MIPNYPKIDGSFVPDAENNRSKWIFVETMNEVAHRLKNKSIAEHVEFETKLGKLREIGVDLTQGFLFGEPGPPGLAASQSEARHRFRQSAQKGRCRTFFDRSVDWKSRPFSETGATPRTRKER
jgi:EAL domain-containing protein (putative c-di-GMP-specific phosphodiesterase class I)